MASFIGSSTDVAAAAACAVAVVTSSSRLGLNGVPIALASQNQFQSAHAKVRHFFRRDNRKCRRL